MVSRAPEQSEWRERLVEGLRLECESSCSHQAVAHGQRVEQAVLELLAEPEYQSLYGSDQVVLTAAALLHGIGGATPWDVRETDCSAYSRARRHRAAAILADNQAFRDCPDRMHQALHLIEHVDDTTRAFPMRGSPGAANAEKPATALSGLAAELTMLREADGLVHVEEAEIAAAIRAWTEHGIPYFVGHGGALTSWRWHDCVAGNLRLVTKRAVVDAHSHGGRLKALNDYDRVEDIIKEQCELRGVRYEPEISPPRLRDASVERMARRSFSFEIAAFHPWDSLEAELRSCTLRYDRSIRPYQTAEIRSEIMDIEALTPLGLYVLENRLEQVRQLHDALMTRYCLGLWDMPGRMQFRYNSPMIETIAPPIVEQYVEEKAYSTPRRLSGIVDGLHRCVAARNLGIRRIRVLIACGVPYPLVPLPVAWEDVHLVRKRRYRYESLDEFPDISQYSDVEVNERNFQYFFFRDLRELGSRGERTFREFEELRAD